MTSPFQNYFVALFLFVAILHVRAQSFDPTPYLTAAESDIGYLSGEYLKPVGIGLANGLNNSWYSTAEVHPLGGFHLNLAPTVVVIPEEGQTFEIQNSKLQELELVNPEDNIAPTAFGPDEPGPLLRSKSTGQSQTFSTPQGVGFSYLPLANINLGAGIGFNTEVDIRFFPKSEIGGLGDAKIGLIGFGVIHEFSRWFLDDKKPPVSISAQFGFTSLSFEQPLQPENAQSNDLLLTMKSKGMTFRLLVSKNISFLTLYGGVGYNTANTNIEIQGTYSYEPTPGQQVTITDPLSNKVTAQGVVGNLGLRVKILKAVAIYTDYTFANYSSFTVGLGLDLNFE